MITLGSLFDGSGGFPLAGSLCGIEPVWASEVEPYPIAVTKSRFPKMLHLGDITKMNGYTIPPVDIITFGSPCQDLSVAGKRAGLKHTENGDEETTRSGLFMEAVRIIKEMRRATNGKYPRIALWENVPGAFSSNKGEDFRIVLEELIKIVEPKAVMPAVPQGGWAYADSYCGDGWSLAYRVFDAQYWGVPQRRRRIHLILDLRSECAGRILFERKGLRRNLEESRAQREGTACAAQTCIGADDRTGEGFDGYNGDPTGAVSATLGVNCGMSTGRNGVIECRGDGRLDAVGADLYNQAITGDKAATLSANSCMTATRNGPSVIEQRNLQQTFVAIPYTLKIRSGCEGGGKGALIQKDKPATLATNNDQYLFQPVGIINLNKGDVQSKTILDPNGITPSLYAGECRYGGGEMYVLDDQGGQQINIRTDGKSPTLRTEMHGNVPCVVSVKFQQINERYLFENHSQDTRYKGPLDVCPMLPAQRGVIHTDNNTAIPIHDKATRYQGGGPTRNGDGAGNGLGVGREGDPSYTITTGDKHAVAYRQGGFADYVEGELGTLKASGGDLGGGSENLLVEQIPRYIVRRLTPTECARLQGFPDTWGHPDHKDDFTDEEAAFWNEVRNTHAAINGKQTKYYTKQQILNWYNKLHTNASEYKMWGNGIALPPALYCMEGIAEALAEGSVEREGK